MSPDLTQKYSFKIGQRSLHGYGLLVFTAQTRWKQWRWLYSSQALRRGEDQGSAPVRCEAAVPYLQWLLLRWLLFHVLDTENLMPCFKTDSSALKKTIWKYVPWLWLKIKFNWTLINILVTKDVEVTSPWMLNKFWQRGTQEQSPFLEQALWAQLQNYLASLSCSQIKEGFIYLMLTLVTISQKDGSKHLRLWISLAAQVRWETSIQAGVCDCVHHNPRTWEVNETGPVIQD